ncbi:MAG: bacteriocin family protein [Labilithrix sp.]|nr:bacteriocin family protein [Labilithrix sp.]MCW5813087.1 bacteriocin family protein [Labilithrix sp.]
MDLLKRKLAPILPEAWKLIDEEATRVLKLHLAGRKIVDFDGPKGWRKAAVSTGRLELLDDESLGSDVGLGIREVQPLIEVRIPIKLSIMELDTVARGADDPDLEPVVRAAEKIAAVENRAIFHGLATAHMHGILESSPHPTFPLHNDATDLPRAILGAKDVLRKAGVNGPYALVLGPYLYDQVYATTDEGYPLAKRIEQQLVDRPIIRAEGVRGAAVVSLRGGDYELTVGQDLSIGYAYHTKDEVELYITESFTFRVLEPSAAVCIAAADVVKA